MVKMTCWSEKSASAKAAKFTKSQTNSVNTKFGGVRVLFHGCAAYKYAATSWTTITKQTASQVYFHLKVFYSCPVWVWRLLQPKEANQKLFIHFRKIQHPSLKDKKSILSSKWMKRTCISHACPFSHLRELAAGAGLRAADWNPDTWLVSLWKL